MKEMKFILWLCAAIFLSGCSDSSSEGAQSADSGEPRVVTGESVTDPLLLEIRDMEKRTRKDTVLDRAAGLRLLRAYQDYYNKHPQDTAAVAYLFEAGRVADALGKYDKAIELLANFHDGTTNRQRKAEAAYLVAFIYDSHLHLPNKAKTQYTKVIELYPESPWADQARQALPLLGKSDEELLQFLKEKNPS